MATHDIESLRARANRSLGIVLNPHQEAMADAILTYLHRGDTVPLVVGIPRRWGKKTTVALVAAMLADSGTRVAVTANESHQFSQLEELCAHLQGRHPANPVTICCRHGAPSASLRRTDVAISCNGASTMIEKFGLDDGRSISAL